MGPVLVAWACAACLELPYKLKGYGVPIMGSLLKNSAAVRVLCCSLARSAPQQQLEGLHLHGV